MKLTALRLEQVQRCYSGLIDKGLAPASVHKVHVVLHSAMKHAQRMRLLVRNPADEASLPKIRRVEMTALSEEQVGELLRTAAGTPVATPLLVLVTLGVRRGELLGFSWGDVDLEAGRLSVRRTLEESSAGVAFKEPKTSRGARTIALPEVMVEALREQHKAQSEMRLRVGPGFNCRELVFPGADGEPWRPSTFGRACRRVFKRAGLQSRLHDLRHTHATMLLRQDVRPKVVMERLGHANVGMTLNTCSHAIPAMQEEAAAGIAGLVFPAK